jgi:hypothetical protein
MEERKLLVVNIDEIAAQWQIPVDTIIHFIVDLEMPLEDQALDRWFADHSELILKEKQNAFDNLLFPRELSGSLAK